MTEQSREIDLVEAARAGSRAAYCDLAKLYQKPLFRFLRMRCGSVQDAEELVQEALLRAWTQLHCLDLSRSFSAWLYTIAARIAVSFGRKRKLPFSTERELDELESEMDPVSVAELAETKQNLWDLAAAILNQTQRSALWLSYAEDRSAREIGEILGMNEVAVRVMLSRSRKRLGNSMKTGQGIGAG